MLAGWQQTLPILPPLPFMLALSGSQDFLTREYSLSQGPCVPLQPKEGTEIHSSQAVPPLPSTEQTQPRPEWITGSEEETEEKLL